MASLKPRDRIQTATGVKTLSLEGLALAVLVGSLFSSLIYRTYAISMSDPDLEFARQFGLIFLLLEILIIAYAMACGMSPYQLFLGLDRWSRIAVGFFVLTFWIGGVLYAPAPTVTYIHQFGWIVHLLFAGAVFYSVERVDRDSIRHFAAIIALSIALTVPIIAFHFGYPPEGLVSPDARFGWGIAIPGFISGRLFGAYCGAILALLAGIALGNDGEKPLPAWLYPAVLLFAGLVIWSGTRAAVLALAGAVLIGLVATGRAPRARAILCLGLCALLAGLIAPHLIPYDDPYFLMFEAKDLSSGNAVSGGRFALWTTTAKIIAQHPLIGSGDGALPWLVPDNVFPHAQPHNVILQFLLSWGMIGALPALFVLVRATWRAHAVVRAKPVLIPLLMMLDALLIMGLLDGMFFFSQFLMLITLLYAAILATGLEQNTFDPSEAKRGRAKGDAAVSNVSFRFSPTTPANHPPLLAHLASLCYWRAQRVRRDSRGSATSSTTFWGNIR